MRITRFLKPCLILFAILQVAASVTSFNCRKVSNTPSGGVVSTATPEATAAGIEMLEAGGNAVDAAVAISFTLAVTEPAMSGLGGQSQFIIFSPSEEPVAINGTSFSPENTPTGASRADIVGHRATTIPSTVHTLEYAWKHYGSGRLTWSQLLQPAIRYAENGFKVGPFRHRVWARHLDKLLRHSSTRALFLRKEGTVPKEGSVWKQPLLAQTLQRLAEHGAADFYSGEIARKIAADMAANGGWITLADLRRIPAPVELSPLKGKYRNWDVYTLPPPGSGWVVLQILNLLERTPPDELTLDSPERLVKLAEALQIGHKNRRENPVKDLNHYQSDVQEKVSKETAAHLLYKSEDASAGETTHFSVVDASGMVVGVTASINAYFGAGVANPELGFLYNDYMHEFETENPEHPFALRPSAMPYSSMSPTILAQAGEAVLVLGSPGSARIISAVVQVIQLWVDAGLDIKDAVSERRIHVIPDHKLYIESPTILQRVRTEFVKRGYTIKEARSDLANGDLNPYFGGVHAIAKENGEWHGAADPRRDGTVEYAELKK